LLIKGILRKYPSPGRFVNEVKKNYTIDFFEDCISEGFNER